MEEGVAPLEAAAQAGPRPDMAATPLEPVEPLVPYTPEQQAEIEEARQIVARSNQEDIGDVRIFTSASLPNDVRAGQSGPVFDRATAAFAERLGEAVGRRVLFFDGKLARTDPGSAFVLRDDKRIFVNVSRGNEGVANVIGHEFTHGLSEEEFGSLLAAFSTIGAGGTVSRKRIANIWVRVMRMLPVLSAVSERQAQDRARSIISPRLSSRPGSRSS